jgi:hypothetical protein
MTEPVSAPGASYAASHYLHETNLNLTATGEKSV